MSSPDASGQEPEPEPEVGEGDLLLGKVPYMHFPFDEALLLGEFQQRFPRESVFREYFRDRLPIVLLAARKVRTAWAKIVPSDFLIHELWNPPTDPEKGEAPMVGLLIADLRRQERQHISSLDLLAASRLEPDASDIKDALIETWQDQGKERGWSRLVTAGSALERKVDMKMFRRRGFVPADPAHPRHAMHWVPPTREPQDQ